MNLKSTISFLLFLLFSISVFAQNGILLVSSKSNDKRILLLNPNDGSVVNPSFIDFAGQSAGVVKGIAQVGDKIWITDQTNDKIFIYDLMGNYVSSIAIGLDNVRGINVINNEVWVANDGAGNGATSDSIMRYTTSGTFLGFYAAPNTSIFDIIDNGNGIVYVSGLTTQGIQKLNYSGVGQGNLVANGVFQNLQQINLTSNGNVVASVFQNHSTSGNNAGIYEISSTDGNILNYYPVAAGNVSGVIETNNGNILYSTGGGLYHIDKTTGTQTQIVAGAFQFFTKVQLPSLAVKEVKKTNTKIYPNPVTDILFVNSDKNLDNIKIYSVDGKIVKNLNVKGNDHKIKVADLPAGNYIIMLTGNGNSTSDTFIKK